MKNLINKAFLIFLFACFFLNANSQSEFEDRSIKLMLRHTTVKASTDESYGGNTFNFAWCFNDFEKGKGRIRYENPTLGDAVFMLIRSINGKPLVTESGLEYAYGSGFMGWFQYYKNVVTKGKLTLSPGISFGDYIFGMESRTSTGSIVTLDPAGYFFAGGPCVMAGFYLAKGFMLDTYLNYDLSFSKFKYERPGYTPVDGYKKPHFMTLGADITHSSGIWFGFKMNSIVDLGDVKAKARRMDFSIGYYFKNKKK